MSGSVDEDDIKEPNYDDAPVTMSMIRMLIDAHPDYRGISHYASNDNKFVMIEIPREPDAFTDGAPGKFVEFVSAIADEDRFVGDMDTIVSERNAAYATLMYRAEIAIKFYNDDGPIMWVAGNGMDEIIAVETPDGDAEPLPHGMFGDLLINYDSEVVSRETVPAFGDINE